MHKTRHGAWAVTAAVALAAASAVPLLAKDAQETLSYTHLYADASGVSHFRTEQLDFKPLGTPNASQNLTQHVLAGAQGATLLRLRQGAVEDWHVAPRTQFLIAVQGESEVTAGDGKMLRLKPGEIMLMDDTAGKGHRTAALGSVDHVALVIPVTAAGGLAK